MRQCVSGDHHWGGSGGRVGRRKLGSLAGAGVAWR